MKYISISFLLLCIFVFPVKSQDVNTIYNRDKISMGLGVGIDYGGIGYNFIYYPQNNLGLFIGGGYAIAGFGYNAGAKIRIVTNKYYSKVTPYVLGMYGYNTAIVVKDANKYNKLFYGFSIGGGIDFRATPTKKTYWSFSILVPFRDPEVDSYIDELTNYQNVDFKTKPMPILISIGSKLIIK